MIKKHIKEKGILANLLEKSIEILLRKECKKIGKININIVSNSLQIIKGIIRNINIIAEDINYKDLLFDEVKLEANDVKIVLKINDKMFSLENESSIKLKISLSENSLKTVLFSNNWNWIGDLISKEILNKSKLVDIKIGNNLILIKASKNDEAINIEEKIHLNAKNGDLYLENKIFNKSIKIPIEDKIYIKEVNIKNNLVNIFANSSISFN